MHQYRISVGDPQPRMTSATPKLHNALRINVLVQCEPLLTAQAGLHRHGGAARHARERGVDRNTGHSRRLTAPPSSNPLVHSNVSNHGLRLPACAALMGVIIACAAQELSETCSTTWSFSFPPIAATGLRRSYSTPLHYLPGGRDDHTQQHQAPAADRLERKRLQASECGNDDTNHRP